MSVAVETRDLFRVHSTPEGDAAALQGLTLTIAEGEILTVLGRGSARPRSCGSSPVWDAVGGGAGVFGRDLRGLGFGGLARYRSQTIGYLDQHFAQALAPELSARELVGLKLRAEGVERRARESRSLELLDRVGLSGKANARPGLLSGGEQQRVALCAALAHRPRLLLADEPTGGAG